VDLEVTLEQEAQARGPLKVGVVGLGWEEASLFLTALGLLSKRRKYTFACHTRIITKRAQSEESSKSEAESPEEEKLSSQGESSDEEIEELPAIRPYAALMQSLAAESGHQIKRRKLGHIQERKVAQSEEVELDQPEKEVADTEDTDHVEEAEEGPETATDDLLQDDEDMKDASDPFELHFADPDNSLLSERLKSLQRDQWKTEKVVLPKAGKAVISVPMSDDLEALVTPPSVSGPDGLKLKQKLIGVVMKQRPSFDDLERIIAPLIFNYQDVLYCDRRPTNAESLRRLTCLHVVNHIFKSVPLV
jgi:U3 small nucleolar RNA-associated protein 25